MERSPFSRLEKTGWKIVHTGGYVFLALKDFFSPDGKPFGVVVGADCASAYRLEGRLLTTTEIEALWARGDEAEGVILISPDRVTEEGSLLLGENFSEVSEAVEILD